MTERSMFSSQGLETEEKRGLGKYIGYGIQKLKINDIEVKTASTGKKQCIFYVETPRITVQGFEPETTATAGGQVGKVRFPKIWVDPNDDGSSYDESTRKKKYLMPDMIHDIAVICDKLNLRGKLDQINTSTFEEYIEQVKPLLVNKFLWFKISGEEYLKQNQKKGIQLSIPRYGFVASESEGPDHLVFDKNKVFDYKAVETPDSTNLDTKGSGDLPF